MTDCCGAIFCKSCLEECARQATVVSTACPTCRQEHFGSMINKQIDREIRSLHIYCTNKEKGCEWQGELNDIRNHLGNSDGCQFEELKCSNECGKMIQRRYLISHVETECPRRKVNCQYCHDTGEHQFIEGQHKEECPKLPLPCPNKCEVRSVLREDMEAHRKECPLEMIQCGYYSVGCKRVKLARKDMENHNKENVEEHLMMTNHELADTKAQLAELTDTKARLAELSDAKDQLAAELTGTKTQLTAELTEAKAQLADLTDARARLAAELTDTKNQLTATLNQKTFSLRQTANLTAILMNAQLGPNTAASHANIRSVHLDSMAEIFKCGNQTCPVTIKMSEYSIKKGRAIQWYSDPFYSHNKGYKMCIRVDAAGNGGGRGTHLSVYMYLMKGPHDDELTWPLRGMFTIQLLNQISDSGHRLHSCIDHRVGRVTEGDRSEHGWGTSHFTSNQDLSSTTTRCRFLKGDCLFFRVIKLEG